jgi:UDP-glucuronate decarboxylase
VKPQRRAARSGSVRLPPSEPNTRPSEALSTMQILVTGGAGFLGSHLCDALLAAGHQVTAIDNFITGSPENVSHLRDERCFRLIEADVIEPLSGLEAEVIYHLASPASPVGYRDHWLETMLVNSAGTLRTLELAEHLGAKYLFCSTSEAYGDPLVHPQTEDYWGNVNPLGRRACYDESKRFGETLTMEFHRERGVDARIARLFNTYGPRNAVNDGRVVPTFIVQALREEPLTCYGDGGQTRSFGYVSDTVAGLVKAMFTDGTAGEVFNLGNPCEMTILEFACAVLAATGSPSEIEFRPLLFPDDPTRRCPDITKALTRLDWEPKVPLEEGLIPTIAYYRQKLGLS